MIDPYAKAIAVNVDKMSLLGFFLSTDSEYMMSFSNGNYSIDIAVDKYYHPSLMINLRDGQGKRFELGTIQEILAPVRRAEDQIELKSVRVKYGLDKPDTEPKVRTEGIGEYAKEALARVLDFLIEYGDQIFATPNNYQEKYKKFEQAYLASLTGIKGGIED